MSRALRQAGRSIPSAELQLNPRSTWGSRIAAEVSAASSVSRRGSVLAFKSSEMARSRPTRASAAVSHQARTEMNVSVKSVAQTTKGALPDRHRKRMCAPASATASA